MDRQEAYSILTEEMQKLAERQAGQLEPICEETMGIDRHGDSGAFYRLELRVEKKSEEQFVVAGVIHDNSGYRFSLLEERLEVNFADKR